MTQTTTTKEMMDKSFFEAEEICGHYVSSDIKKLWAVDLDLLSEFERVCNKYNIRYFADGGTLLGAVRHKGFIPWDDDIDIQIFAEDYEKLCKVAPTEFKYPYFWQTYETERGFSPWHAKLRRSDTTGCTDFEIKNAPTWNKGIFIDIFPLYNIPESELKFKIQCMVIKFIKTRIIGGFEVLRSLKANKNVRLRNYFNISIPIYAFARLFGDHDKWCSIYTKICGWEKEKTSRVGVTSASPGKKNLIWERELFDETTELPFEGRMIKAPKRYDERLRVQYGEYNVIKKGAAQHSTLTIDADTPYTEYKF